MPALAGEVAPVPQKVPGRPHYKYSDLELQEWRLQLQTNRTVTMLRRRAWHERSSFYGRRINTTDFAVLGRALPTRITLPDRPAKHADSEAGLTRPGP